MWADDQHEEVILIAFDNSGWMDSLASKWFDDQLAAIRLYCHAKLQSNPKNAIGLSSMSGGANYSSYLAPTSDVDKIVTFLHRGIKYGGDLDLDRGIACSLAGVTQLIFQAKLKRVLFCVRSPASFNFDAALEYGSIAKRLGVAVDVVNFRPKLKHELEGFVVAADNYANSHIKHIQPGSSLPVIREALSSFPPIITRELMEQGEIAAAAAMKKKDKEKAGRIRELELLELLLNPKGKNQVAAPLPPPKAPGMKLWNQFNLDNDKVMLAKGKMLL